MVQKLKCFVFSDLHINAAGSRFEKIKSQLMQEIVKADIIIMNGDIIEMFYPKHLSQESYATNAYEKAAIDGVKWVADLLDKHPNKQFFYLEGNHENCDRFRDGIRALRSAPPFGESNLIWGRTYMRIGDGLFFHGDNETRRQPVEKRERGQLEDIVSGRLAHNMNITFEAPVMGIMRFINTRTRTTNRIFDFLTETAPERLKGTQHMFFGHTHLPMINYDNHGLKWHNTGSAARFGKDNFLSFDLEVPEESEFRTEDKRAFYPGAEIVNIKRVELNCSCTNVEKHTHRDVVVSKMIR